MIELRWYIMNSPHGEVKVLQYRQKIDTTIRAGMWSNEDMIKTASYAWSDWVDVPEYRENISS